MAGGNVAALQAAIEKLRARTILEQQEALEILQIYINNLREHPTEKKYHRINAVNVHFQERIGRLACCEECMAAIGYKKVSPEWFEYDAAARDPARPEVAKELEDMDRIISEQLEGMKQRIEVLPVRLSREHAYNAVRGVGYFNMTGRRQTNEDDEICVDQFCGDKSVAYFGLYDGHGGRQSVDYVVKALHLSLEHLLREHPDMPVAEALTRAYVMTDGQLRRRNILQSGTTGVSVVIKRDPRGRRVLYAANVGDSRAVVSRGGSAMRLTVDHKPNLPEERKRIEEAGGWINEKRVNGVLAISRALGDHMLKSNNVITAVPYVFELELTDNEDYLILACDGVWDVMTDQEAVDFVLQQMSEVDADGPDLNRELEQCARNLVQAAYDKKSMDNITVIVVRL